MIEAKNLEIHLVDHCNLDCVRCSHESPFAVRRFEIPKVFARSLEELWKWYRAPLLKLVGGEPLLHPKIADIIAIAKKITGAQVRIVTNGTLLMRQYKQLINSDEIHISVYPNVKIPDDILLLKIADNINVRITTQTFEKFRIQRFPVIPNSILTARIFSTCQVFHQWQCHTLRDGLFYPCPPAATWGDSMKDGISLVLPNKHLELDLVAATKRQKPFNTCSLCLGSVGTIYPHCLGWSRSHVNNVLGIVDFSYLKQLEKNPNLFNGCFRYTKTLYPDGKIINHEKE
jgi:organic radical activating enzyme